PIYALDVTRRLDNRTLCVQPYVALRLTPQVYGEAQLRALYRPTTDLRAHAGVQIRPGKLRTLSEHTQAEQERAVCGDQPCLPRIRVCQPRAGAPKVEHQQRNARRQAERGPAHLQTGGLIGPVE